MPQDRVSPSPRPLTLPTPRPLTHNPNHDKELGVIRRPKHQIYYRQAHAYRRALALYKRQGRVCWHRRDNTGWVICVRRSPS